MLRRSGFAERIEVCQIRRPAAGALVGHELPQPNDGHRLAIDLTGLHTGKRLLPGNPVDAGQQVDAHRRTAQLDNAVRQTEVLGRKADAAETEGIQRSQDPQCVFRGGVNLKVQIAGETRPPMVGQRVSFDEQVLNAVRVERRKQISEVPR